MHQLSVGSRQSGVSRHNFTLTAYRLLVTRHSSLSFDTRERRAIIARPSGKNKGEVDHDDTSRVLWIRADRDWDRAAGPGARGS